MQSSNWRVWVLVCTGAALAGCGGSGNDGPVKGMSSRDAQRLNAERSQFERSDDPPFTADTHFAAARLAETQNAFAQAIAQYQAALKLDRNHRPSLYRLGIVYAQQRQYTDAIAIWDRYIQATGGDATGYSNLGYTYELSGDAKKAEDAYLKGIKADGKNEPCRVNYALMLVRQDRPDDAEKQLAAVLPPAQVRYNIASAYQQLGRPDQARAEYRKALELDPSLGAAKTRLAELTKE